MQVVPLSENYDIILKEYMKIRGGKSEDLYSLVKQVNNLTERALASAIKRYIKKRGVHTLSIHSVVMLFPENNFWRNCFYASAFVRLVVRGRITAPSSRR